MFRGVVRASFNSQPLIRWQAVPAHLVPRLFSTRSPLLKDNKKQDDDWDKILAPYQNGPSTSASPTTSSSKSELSSSSSTSSPSPPPSPPLSQGRVEDGNRSVSSPLSSMSPEEDLRHSVELSWHSVLSAIENNVGDIGGAFREQNAKQPYNKITTNKSLVTEIDPEIEFEELWQRRPVRGLIRPGKPSDGRTVDIDQKHVDFQRGYQIMNSILGRNNVRHELRLGERYEKPNQKKRRLRSERHRRRFADAVKQKVQLIMELKARGA